MTWTGSWESCLRISSPLRPKLTAADLRELRHGCGAGETVTADMVWAALWPSEDAEHAGDAPTARLLLSLYVYCVCSGAESWGDLGSSGWAQPQCLSSLLRAGWPLSAPKPALKGCFVPASPCLLVCHRPLCHRGQQCPSIPSLLSCSTPNPSPGEVPALPLLPTGHDVPLSPRALVQPQPERGWGVPRSQPNPMGPSPSRAHQQVKLPGSAAPA